MGQSYQLIIFDWDGTLVDSQQHIVACMQSAFEQAKLEPPKAPAIRHIVGLSLDRAISQLAPELDYEAVGKLAYLYRTTSFANTRHASELFQGVRTSLEILRQQNFYLAVATGKGRTGLDRAMSNSGIAESFDITRCADETCSKPHPQMLEEILTDLNLNIDQAVMVGDTVYDIDMANNLGMDSIAVTYGMHGIEQLRASSPSYIIDDITEIQDLVSRN